MIENSKMRFKCGFGFGFGPGLEIGVVRQTQQANLELLVTKNTSKQQSKDTQGAVMHSGLLSKKTH